ncbi:hypothetical protein [Streptomyces hesseae]|uniref:Uncharacterized protein n=1 Tax=Streptomyces hesseae TaxID=3075519 RepID=A0ABU2SR98_9ACTN|nr:hypothetical protein [Streptomyces sp. DSM 40473]MDT0451417.1 hypothetical protein [Streptomyces sp. DSM 40473]
MTKADRPKDSAEWRELLKAGFEYEYPEEIQQAPKRSLRRRARKIYRQDQKVELKRRIAEERRREPVTAGGAVVVVVCLLLVGLAADHWWPDHAGAPSTVVQAGGDAPGAEARAGRGGSPGAAPSPAASGAAPKADLSTPEKTAEGWARAYMTRNPPVDKDQKVPVRRAAPWMTEALEKNLEQFDDKAWYQLVADGGVATVDKVTVGPADDDRVRKQADTPTRVWRRVTVETTVAGYQKHNDTKVLLTEITRGDDGWRVGRVLGV